MEKNKEKVDYNNHPLTKGNVPRLEEIMTKFYSISDEREKLQEEIMLNLEKIHRYSSDREIIPSEEPPEDDNSALSHVEKVIYKYKFQNNQLAEILGHIKEII